jgi:hypothetical protein
MLSEASNAAWNSSGVMNGSSVFVSVVRPAADLVAVIGGHAQHLGDHTERQREREVDDDVHRPARRDPVERLVDQSLHPGPQALDRLRCERLRYKPAEAVVVGRVEVEHRPPSPAAVARHLPQLLHPGQGVGVGFLDAEGGIAQDPDDVVVPAQVPRSQRGAVDGVLLPEAPVLVVGPGVEAGFERVEDGGFLIGGRRHIAHVLHGTVPATSAPARERPDNGSPNGLVSSPQPQRQREFPAPGGGGALRLEP